MSKNMKITLIFGGFITAVAAAFYPIFFHPLTHTEEYSKLQRFYFNFTYATRVYNVI